MFLVKLVAKEEHTTDRMQYIMKISQTFSRKSRREKVHIITTYNILQRR